MHVETQHLFLMIFKKSTFSTLRGFHTLTKFHAYNFLFVPLHLLSYFHLIFSYSNGKHPLWDPVDAHVIEKHHTPKSKRPGGRGERALLGTIHTGAFRGGRSLRERERDIRSHA
jgi:hypothetical protein